MHWGRNSDRGGLSCVQFQTGHQVQRLTLAGRFSKAVLAKACALWGVGSYQFRRTGPVDIASGWETEAKCQPDVVRRGSSAEC